MQVRYQRMARQATARRWQPIGRAHQAAISSQAKTVAGTTRLSVARGESASAIPATPPAPRTTSGLAPAPYQRRAIHAPSAANAVTAAAPSQLFGFPNGTRNGWRPNRRPTAPPIPSPRASASSAPAAAGAAALQPIAAAVKIAADTA